jgi:cysteine desulfurase
VAQQADRRTDEESCRYGLDLGSGLRLPVYLDGHATMPLWPEAAAAMAPWWSQRSANAHSAHAKGQEAAQAVEHARREVASLVGASPTEIVFTSGATESNNLALIGAVEAARAAGDGRREIIVSAIEHKSVLSCAGELSRRGYEVRMAPVDREGLLDLAALYRLASEATLLVAVMAANNEIGTIQPLGKAIEIARAAGAMVHVDATQAAGKIPTDVADCDFASISSHKIGGPPGVGALFVSAAAPYRPRPLFFGGAQEGGLRPGTIPVPLVVGFGAAASLAAAQLAERSERQRRLADRFLAALDSAGISWTLNGSSIERLPGSLNLRIAGLDAASTIARLSDRACFAEGSACTSGEILPSHVLTAMGLSQEEAAGSLRLYCGPGNCEAEIDLAAAVLIDAIQQI